MTWAALDRAVKAVERHGLDGPVISKVLSLLARGNFWLLLSNGYKVSHQPPLWDDVVPIVRRFIESAPDRVIPQFRADYSDFRPKSCCWAGTVAGKRPSPAKTEI